MLIMTQDRKCLFNLEMAGDLHLSSHYGGYEEGKPVKVLASLPLAEDVTENWASTRARPGPWKCWRILRGSISTIQGPPSATL